MNKKQKHRAFQKWKNKTKQNYALYGGKGSEMPHNKTKQNYTLHDVEGNEIPIHKPITPVLRGREDGMYEFVATAFYIHPRGAIVTAKHVVEDYYKKGIPLFVVTLLPNNEFRLRKITKIFSSEKGVDAVVCYVQEIEYENKEVLMPIFNIFEGEHIPMSENIKTCGYPNSRIIDLETGQQQGLFELSWSQGEITKEYPNGRDKTFLPTHCYETSMEILGGARGAPVLNSNGEVCGINSTGYELPINETPVSYITPISAIFPIKVEGEEGTITIQELIEKRLL